MLVIEMGNEKLKRTLLTITTVTVVGLGSLFFSTPASADNLEELNNKQTQIQNDREALKANLSDAESEVADLLIELEEINKEIEKATTALNENQKTMDKNEVAISDTQEEVDKLEEEIVELEEAIEKRFEILKERAASYQKNGGNISYIEVLFGSQNFGDFISRVNAVNKITESDNDLMKQIDEDKVKVEDKQDVVLSKLDELKEMKTELEGMAVLIKEQQIGNEDRKADLKEKESTLVAKVNDLEIKDTKLASLEREVRQNIDSLTQPEIASASTNDSDGNLTTLSKEKSNSSAVSAAPRSAATGGVSTAMNAGFSHIGTPYVWGGKGPGGFDCSGFVSWAFAQGGISIPSSTSGLAGTGTKVSESNMQPGDIVFFNTYKTNGHVGIYLGGGKFIGAQNSTGLAVADMSNGYWAGKFSGHVRSVK